MNEIPHIEPTHWMLDSYQLTVSFRNLLISKTTCLTFYDWSAMMNRKLVRSALLSSAALGRAWLMYRVKTHNLSCWPIADWSADDSPWSCCMYGDGGTCSSIEARTNGRIQFHRLLSVKIRSSRYLWFRDELMGPLLVISFHILALVCRIRQKQNHMTRNS